jgi:hypothetical protein
MKPIEPDKIDYKNIDYAYVNYGFPEDVWEKMLEADQKHLEAHPTCEICEKRSSVRITPVGTLRAACLECIDGIRAQIRADVEEKMREHEAEEREHRRRIEERELEEQVTWYDW